MHLHIALAAHDEFRKINPGIERKARVGQDLPLIVDLEVVHVGAVGVNLGADRMPGAMNEILPEAGLVDVITRGPVHFPAGHLAALSYSRLNGLDTGVAVPTHSLQNLARSIG